MASEGSMKSFAFTVFALEIFFALIYGFRYNFSASTSNNDYNGLFISMFLAILLLVGFGLQSTYLKGSALVNLIYTFMIIAFTIQLYFLMANFWITARLSDGNSSNTYPSYNQVFNYIRLSGTSNMAYSKLINEVTLSQAIACAISMFVGIFPVLGRVGPMEVLLICLIGTFAYALNEGVFWNLFIEDNGYGMRIFLFGSSMGIITSLILGKREKTAQHPEYTTDYDHQFTGLVGSVFICVLLPWLSVIDQLPGMAEATYFQIAPLNIWLAISGSVCTSFCTSIWLHGKISNHEIVMSCFSGAIAYGSSSNVFPNPFPAILIGCITGVVVTVLNRFKRRMNSNGVYDSLGSLQLFFTSGIISAIYSAILFAAGALPPVDGVVAQTNPQTTKYIQGCYQLVGMCISIGIGAFFGALIGLLAWVINKDTSKDQLFNESVYLQKDDEVHAHQSAN